MVTRRVLRRSLRRRGASGEQWGSRRIHIRDCKANLRHQKALDVSFDMAPGQISNGPPRSARQIKQARRAHDYNRAKKASKFMRMAQNNARWNPVDPWWVACKTAHSVGQYVTQGRQTFAPPGSEIFTVRIVSLSVTVYTPVPAICSVANPVSSVFASSKDARGMTQFTEGCIGFQRDMARLTQDTGSVAVDTNPSRRREGRSHRSRLRPRVSKRQLQ